MKTIWPRLRDQGVGNLVILHIPLMLNLQLSHTLGSSKCDWELLNTAHEVVLTLIENRLLLEDGENLGLAVEVVLTKHEDGQLVDIDVGLGPLHGEELRALWARGSQLLDPFWFWTWCHCVKLSNMSNTQKLGYIGEERQERRGNAEEG